MNNLYEEIKSKTFSAMRALAKECPPFDDARMIFGSSESKTSLARCKTVKAIDTEWIEKIEAALPALDVIIRNPSVAIEDVDEVLPVELSRHITEKSIKHLAQHTNYILDIKADGEIVPQKILNVFHEETALTYENKFVNTLLNRLSAFVDKRMRALAGTSGIEMNYRFGYTTEFDHFAKEGAERNSAKIELRIELTSPLGPESSETDAEINERYESALERIKRINMAIIGYGSSAFAQKLGRNYVRPPIIRTNAILKNKDLKECLNLWEYIESYDKVGYSLVSDKYYEMPSDDFVGSMYSAAALQYVTFYSGITGGMSDARLLSEKHLFDVMPEFDDEIQNEDIEDYNVYDSEYRKTVPVSRLINNRKKLSDDEKLIRRAVLISLKADEKINEAALRSEMEERRIARERRIAEEEERRRAMEALRRHVTVQYKRSFLARYTQSPEILQDYYTEIKNYLLSYSGVKSRISWSKDSFYLGKVCVAKIDVRGKTLYLYIALDPDSLESKYHAASVGGSCPTLIKIKSERKKKYAKELIARAMKALGATAESIPSTDYHIPYEDDDALIAEGLIKYVLPKGVTIDENTVIIKAAFTPPIKKAAPEKTELTSDDAAANETIAQVEQIEEQSTEI